MKNYLLRNDKVQHAQRLALERWFSERNGRRVAYCDILHELQSAKLAEIEAGSQAK